MLALAADTDASPPAKAPAVQSQPPTDGRESAEEQLSAAIRRLIRDEMGQPEPPGKPHSTATETWRQGLIVVALICIVLFSSHWVPLYSWFTKDQIDLARTVGTFLGGGLIFARNDWLRGHVAGLAERRGILGLLLALLAIVLFARFAAFRFHLAADPDFAKVYADNQLTTNGGSTQPLGIDGHVFEVRGSRPERQKGRRISMTGSAMVFRLLTGQKSLRWPLLMRIDLNYPAADEYTVEATRTDAPFDDDFRSRINEYQTDTQAINSNTISVSSPGKIDSGVIWLPYGGTYNLILRQKRSPDQSWKKCGLAVNDRFLGASEEDEQVSFEDRVCKP